MKILLRKFKAVVGLTLSIAIVLPSLSLPSYASEKARVETEGLYAVDSNVVSYGNDAEEIAANMVSNIEKYFSQDSSPVLTEETENAATKLLTVGKVEPDGYNDPANDDPYGFGKGVPFLINEEDELFTLLSFDNWASGTSFGIRDVLTNVKGRLITSFKSLAGVNLPNNSDYSNVLKAMNYAKAVAFDPTKSGRKDHVAVVGVHSNKNAYIMVYDAAHGVWSGYRQVGSFSWIGTSTSFYEMNNFLDITAGDYDGDGVDTVIVYGAFDRYVDATGNTSGRDNSSYGLFEYKVTHPEGTNNIYINNIIQNEVMAVRGNNLLNPAYREHQPTIIPVNESDDHDDGRERLVGTIETGDVNGDGIDDLVVLSYNTGKVKNPDRFPVEFAIPYLAVAFGQKSSSPKTVLYNTVSGAYVRGAEANSSYDSMRAAGLAVVNTDNQKGDEIIVAGQKIAYEYKMSNNVKVYDDYDYNDDINFAKYAYNGNGGISQKYFTNQMFNGYGSNDFVTAGLNKFSQYSISDTWDSTYAMIAVQGVYMNGLSNPGYVIVAGDIYDVSEQTVPRKVFDYKWFDDQDNNGYQGGASMTFYTTFIYDIAVGNFNHNKYGAQQAVMTVMRRESGADDYAVSIVTVGIDDSKRDANTGIPADVTAAVYTSTNIEEYDVFNKGGRLGQGLNIINIPVDCDSDGVLARYKDKSYSYTDPEVLAVLQAAPRFEELNDYYYDGFSTGFTIEETSSYSRGSSNSVSFGVGGNVEMMGTVGGVELSLGYALDWTESFETTLSYSISQTWNAQATDSVVVYRTPLFFYAYDVYENGVWEDQKLVISTVHKPVYQQLSLSEYNTFVDEYNKLVGKISTRLVKLDAEANFLEIAGNPYKYNNPSAGGVTLYGSPQQLGYNSSSVDVEYAQSKEEAKSIEEAHGFEFEITTKFGFDGPFVEATAGAHASLQYMSGKSTTYTSGSGVGYKGGVQDIDGNAMRDDDYGDDQIYAYGFTWQLASWNSTLPTGGLDENNNPYYVPVIGYVVSQQKSLAKPMGDVEVSLRDADFDGDYEALVVEWEDPYDSSTGYPKCMEYIVYLVTNGNLSEVGTVPYGTNEFVFTTLDGRTTYEFVVAGKMASGVETLRSEPGYRFLDQYTVGIKDIQLSGSTGNKDTYVITMTDGKTFTYDVTNGVSIERIDKIDTLDNVDSYAIHLSDGSSYVYRVTNGVDGKDGEKGEKGEKGENGETGKDGTDGRDGKDGVGISAIAKTGTSGNVDTYTIYLTDGRTFSYTVTNGINGTDGKDGKDGADGARGTDGKDGKDGRDGKDGSEGTPEHSMSGEVMTFYFDVSSDEIQGIAIDGVELDPSKYCVSSTGEGTMILVSDDAVPLGNGIMSVQTDMDSFETEIGKHNGSIPIWIIVLLAVWNLVLTAGVALLALKQFKK